ncbi:MAG TPA: hypothetical protein VNP94_10790 [Actinomycetota bacterium]|nr:hypothetical protein [Actinomycetota bacterium]
MDRLEQLGEVRRLAARIVAERGTDGDARAAFLEQAVAFPHVSSSERVKIWNEAAGIDNRTGLPIR